MKRLTPKLTSSIDSSLTKKRFKIMGKKISPFRNKLIQLSLLPILLLLVLPFCINYSSSENYVADELQNGVDGRIYKSDPILFSKKEEVYLETGTSYFKATTRLMYDEKGLLYTGVRRFKDRETREPSWEEIFENGVKKKSIFLRDQFINNHGTTPIIYTKGQIIVFSFEDGFFTEIGYDKDDNLTFRKEITTNDSHFFGPENELLMRIYIDVIEGERKIVQTQWYPNGQLMFESTFDSSGHWDSSPVYDEEGNIYESNPK